MSFFDEVVKFFSQIVEGRNDYMEVFRKLLGVLLDAIEFVRTTRIFSDNGNNWGWILPIVILILVVNFVRGA